MMFRNFKLIPIKIINFGQLKVQAMVIMHVGLKCHILVIIIQLINFSSNSNSYFLVYIPIFLLQ